MCTQLAVCHFRPLKVESLGDWRLLGRTCSSLPNEVAYWGLMRPYWHCCMFPYLVLVKFYPAFPTLPKGKSLRDLWHFTWCTINQVNFNFHNKGLQEVSNKGPWPSVYWCGSCGVISSEWKPPDHNHLVSVKGCCPTLDVDEFCAVEQMCNTDFGRLRLMSDTPPLPANSGSRRHQPCCLTRAPPPEWSLAKFQPVCWMRPVTIYSCKSASLSWVTLIKTLLSESCCKKPVYSVRVMYF